MSNTNIKATAYTQPTERTIFRLAPPRHGRTASKRECYEFENTAVDRTCDLAVQYGIDLGEVREWLTANPSHAAWVRTFAREGGHSCPTTLIAVRDLVPISPDVWLVQLVKAPFDQDRRATSALKHLAWQVVRGVWPPQVGPDLHDYNAAVAEALYQLPDYDARLGRYLLRRAGMVINLTKCPPPGASTWLPQTCKEAMRALF